MNTRVKVVFRGRAAQMRSCLPVDKARIASRSALAALFLFFAFAPAGHADPPKHAEWERTFHDEFEGADVDWEVWQSDAASRGAKNLEGRWPENNVVRDGILRQVTRRENPARAGKEWSTAHLWTKQFTQRYGYFEARMRYGRYLNNAFWLYRPRGRFPERPHFEIDVNEGHTPREVAMTFHFYYYPEGDDEGNLISTGIHWDAPLDLDKEFHLYGVEWDESRIVWYFDGKPVRVLENPMAHAPADVRLSTVIMDRALEKDKVPLDTMDGVSMEVDWVRVYRKVKDLVAPELPPAEKCEVPRVVPRQKQVSDQGKRTLLFAEDFEKASAGAPPAGWESGDGTPDVVPDSNAGGRPVLAPGNKILRLKAGDYLFRLLDAPAAGRLEVEFDCYMPSKQEGLLFVTLGAFDKADPEKRKTSYYTGDIGPYIHWQRGFLSYYTEAEKWTHFAFWPSRRWQKVRFLLDVKAGVFDCYTGAGAFVGGGAFRGKQAQARGIGLRHRGESWPVYADNVVVRRLDEGQ